ncbi:DUF2922 domain-containing protein [Peribacillus frigoritolerans]|nr:DUF2922 domain-containing protein [Peribacillus frigoritolerans]
MAKVLELIFVTEEGKSATISLDNPKEPVEVNTVKLAMEKKSLRGTCSLHLQGISSI